MGIAYALILYMSTVFGESRRNSAANERGDVRSRRRREGPDRPSAKAVEGVTHPLPTTT